MNKRACDVGRKGQMQISFGMIFSIILIIVFLAFAFYGIKVFLKTGDSAKAAKFIDELQGDLDRIWGSAVSSETIEYVVPGYADFVCFIDFDSDASGGNRELYSDINESVDYLNSNFVFYPIKYNGYEYANLGHINLVQTTEEENPLCIRTNNGRVSIVLRKDYGENYATVSGI